MRAIPESMDREIVSEIDRRLAAVTSEANVAIPWAIESGSRAWGFPSPDSDYDCRFIFVRPAGQYLSPWRARDVIETPLDRIFDVNGWDLIKAVKLLVKGNATVVEWLRSPIVYDGDPAFRETLLDLAREVADPALIANHYRHLAERQWADAQDASLKKVFYALRPALCLRWMRQNPNDGAPPMTLSELLAESDPPAAVVAAALSLVETKSVTREIGRGAVDPVLLEFVSTTIASQADESPDYAAVPRRRVAVDEFFRMAVDRWGGV